MGMDRPIGVPVKADASLPGFRSNKALLFKAGNQSVSQSWVWGGWTKGGSDEVMGVMSWESCAILLPFLLLGEISFRKQPINFYGKKNGGV